MTSRFGNRATGVAAATAIVLLVLLIVLLWTGVGQDFFQSKRAEPSRRLAETNGSDLREPFEDGSSPGTGPEDVGRDQQRKANQMARGDSREYVRPMKISPPGLNKEDLLYGSDQVQDGNAEPVQLRHHSGHFRHRTANIWDPHPIYEFTAFQKDFLLVLEHDSGFASPDLKVTHIWRNSSTRRLPNIKSNGCFYKGYVKGDPSSSVAVSLCHGMTGNIRTSTGNYFIEPFEVTSDHAKPIEHVIYEMSKTGKNGKDLSHCGMDDYESLKFHVRKGNDDTQSRKNSEILFDYETGDRHHSHYHEGEDTEDYESLQSYQHKRSRRSPSEEYFVEMLVVADSSMANYHGSNTENYILALMYIVSGIFKDASIGNPITIAVVKLEIHYELSFVKYRYPHHDGVSAAEMLREFCHDQALKNDNNEDSPFHHDTALLLTRENICRNASAQKCETLGLAELGTMCDKRSSCSLVQDNGLSAAFTIAHELGHVFNMPHDDAELKCRAHPSSDSISHVMSTSLKEGTDPWSWSECSRHFITEFLESRHSFCLRDRPVKDIIKENVPPDIFPGETIVGNRQCELLYGPGSRICSFMPVCSALWCNKLDSDGCQTLHMPWGDGTPCGEGAWCQKGVCVEKNRKALKKVDGGWGEWEPYGSCSRTCGGGIKKSYRYCNNPRPQNGGSYCIGKRVQYKSCGTKNCPEQSRDFRQEQCSAFDNNNHNIHGIPVNVTWVPKYGLLNDDRCVLYCRPYQGTLYYPLKDKVIDGTPCAPDSFDICVNGQCKPAGCDHVLNSKAKLDLCGKCNGSNDTCRLMTGTFNESATEQGSRFVVNIPAGSSNLDIRQYGINGTRDDNYLVLKDGVTKGGLLNNKNVLTTFRKMIVYDGVTLEYTGCLKAVERINASRPLRKALLVEVLSVGNLTPPNISYQYTVPLNNLKRFLWRHLDDEWESCDKVCKGRRKRKIVCVSVYTNEVVEDDFCRNSKQLSPIYEPCNMGCTLKWEITARSECLHPCGPGIRTVTKECIQEIVGDPKPYTVSNSACAHLPNRPRDFEECEGLCSSVDWEYSEWSECSKSCGSGTHVREAFCVDKMRNQHVEEERCDPVTKVVEEVCQTQSCPIWSTGEWSECSVTCGIGKRIRDLWCQHGNQVIKMSYCDANTMPKREDVCMKRCTFWSSLEWGPCSATCGPGKKQRITVCKNHEGKNVDDSECRIKEKPSEYEKCYLQPCPPPVYNAEDNSIPTEYSHRRSSGNFKRIRNEYPRFPRWQTSEWSSCSVTCGTGYQKRKVQCVAFNSREANMCNPHREPNSTRPCIMAPCPSQLKWVEGEWSPCTKSCGKGTQQRQVLCSNTADRVYLKDEDCSHLGPKPDVEKVCWMTCKHRRGYKWKYEKWSPCSKTCGLGENVRQVKCMNVTTESNEIGRRKINGTVVDDRFCRSINRRRDRKKCERKLCSHTWVEGEWSECSSKCGTGSQSRNVTCHQVNSYGWLDPMPLKSDRACDLSVRPSSIRDCPTMNCKSPFYWSPEEWQECTQPCGRKGIQRRTYKCRDREGKIRKKTDCSGLNKPPPKSKPCNRRLCGLLSCKEVQLHTNARLDGEYIILVGGKNMSIYCKGMNTASPEEYLTLHYPDDNYSEYYDERLINLSACQKNGTRADNCNCVMENRFGTTNFHKVRLIVETLQIRTDDFTFAQSQGRPIPLGEAGDCCCKQLCTEGSFRINLGGTSLQVSRMERWVMKTFETLDMRIEGFQISGRCVRSGKSGTCGSCGPSTAGRLKLDVVPP